jgi:outer membrane protein
MKIKFLFSFLTIFFITNAQQILTIDEAIEIALKKNFDILVARNEADIAKINNTAGNAGMLPSINLAGSGNYEINNEHQELSGGNESNYPSLSTTSVNAGAELTWTLFDGGKMFVTKSKLNEIEALGEIQFKNKVLQSLFNVVAAYYDVVKQKQQLNSINEVINFNSERVTISQTGLMAGSLIKSDLLQAKIDLNIAMENAINQKSAIIESKYRLNELLGRSNEQLFEVSDSIPLNYSPDTFIINQQIDSLNTNILFYRKQVEVARLSLKENNRLYSPILNLRAGYYLSQTDKSGGNILENRTYGPQIGGTIIFPLYSAGENRRKINGSKLQVQSAEYDFQNIKLQVNTDLQNALTEFKNQKSLVEIEKENNLLARENLEISMQRLRLGQTTSIEVHQAQENFVQSFTRLINFEYNLKIAETRLKQLIASL